MIVDDLERYFSVVEHTAAQAPDRAAVIDDTGELSYRELLSRADRRAELLLQAGLQPQERVALVADNSANFLVAAFAIWRMGGVVVTIYPSSVVADLAYCIESADPALVLGDRRTIAALREAITDDRPVVDIDSEEFTVDAIRSNTKPNPADLRAPLRLITYSSGTTSRPKAIMLSGAALLNGAETFAAIWHLTAEDRTIVALPMAWLFGLASTSMTTLYAGGTVIALRRGRPDMICEAIAVHQGTFLAGVTTMFTKLVNHLETLNNTPNLNSLRLCVSGGEPRNELVFDKWKNYTGCAVLDNFCASENFPLVTYDPTTDPVPVRQSAGKLVPKSELRIVDTNGEDVTPGEVGEALTRGPGLMLGYWGDPEATAEAFTPDGYYRQRDLVRIDERGYVYVVGRLSDMIIRGGSNVSPAEVERVLRDHASVTDVAVVGLPDDTYGQQVVAAVTMADGAVLDEKELSRFAAEQLASFKVPTRFVVLQELPQNTTTGKVDRRQVAAALESRGVHA